ncbi:MAG: SCO family protein [Armatimonadetes bacterium]|nr:SCO family protein [Armatimonadota bacterium]
MYRAVESVRRFLWLALLGLLWHHPVYAQSPAVNLSTDVGLDQRLGEQVPLDVTFRDEAGRTVTLGDYLGDRPVVLGLVYYRCPMLCNQVLNGMLKVLRVVKYDVGKEFDVVLVSIDPRETPDVAAAKKESYVRSYSRPGAEEGWHFLTGDEAAIQRVAQAVGYRYVYDPETDLYAHPAGIMVLTPEGKLGQYFYGIEYFQRDLTLALTESSDNRIGTLVDQIILYCFAYDPTSGKYGLLIMRVIRVLGVGTVLLLASYIVVMSLRDRRRAAARALGSTNLKGGKA